MPLEERGSLLGTLTRLSGYRGGFLLVSPKPFSEDFEMPGQVFLQIEGLPVPFFVEEWSVRSDSSLVVRFEEPDSDERAREFLGCTVYANLAIEEESSGEPSLEDLLGYKVVDADAGFVGVVTDVLYYGENVLFQVDKDGKELLVPVHEDLIEGVDPEAKIIHAILPEGLLGLFLLDDTSDADD